MSAIDVVELGDLRRVDIAPGFRAITRSAALREALERMIASGGAVQGALLGSLLVGYAVDVPLGPPQAGEVRRRWHAVPDAHECAIEVARGFRGRCVARRLLAAAFSAPRLDRKIVIGDGLVWHWDLDERDLSPAECRARLLALLESGGFQRFETDEPEITSSPYNFLVARIGPAVAPPSARAFQAALEAAQGTAGR